MLIIWRTATKNIPLLMLARNLDYVEHYCSRVHVHKRSALYCTMAVLHWLWATTLLSAIASSGAVVYDNASTLQNAACPSETPVSIYSHSVSIAWNGSACCASVATYTARHQARLEVDVAFACWYTVPLALLAALVAMAWEWCAVLHQDWHHWQTHRVCYGARLARLAERIT